MWLGISIGKEDTLSPTSAAYVCLAPGGEFDGVTLYKKEHAASAHRLVNGTQWTPGPQGYLRSDRLS